MCVCVCDQRERRESRDKSQKMRRENKHRNVLYRYTRPQTTCAEARLGQNSLWAPTRPPQHSMSVHILIVSDRSLQNSTSRRYSSTMFSSCWSAAQSRVSRRRRRRPGACAAHGEVSSLRAFAWAAWRSGGGKAHHPSERSCSSIIPSSSCAGRDRG